MTIKEFTFPQNFKDLRQSSSINGFIVRDITSPREISQELKQAFLSYRKNGVEFVFDSFDVFYSILIKFEEIEPNDIETAWELLIKSGTNLHENYLRNNISNESLAPEDKHRVVTATKMLIYLISQMTQLLDKKESDLSKNIMNQGTKGRKKIKSNNSSWDSKYESMLAIDIFKKILLLNIRILWNPPIVEEGFVNAITSCCYKLMENKALMQSKELKDVLFDVIGVAIKNYNHSISSAIKIVQLLKYFEHLASTLAKAVHGFSEKFNEACLVSRILGEISQLSYEDLDKENSGLKVICQFLIELASLMPTFILKNISLLIPSLDGESYLMRNCVLQVFQEIIVHGADPETLSDKDKHTRDQFLDRLIDHLHDNNAFVRSKCLQIWYDLCTKNAIPLAFRSPLLKFTIERLGDKSNIVRKHAIILLTELLGKNPYGSHFKLEELKLQLVANEDKLIEMREANPEPKTAKEPGEEDEEEMEQDQTGIDESVANMSLNEEQSADVDPAIAEAFKGQINMINFLKDSIEFVELIKASFPIISALLNSKVISDVAESIKYYVTAHQFGFAEARIGIQQVLHQINSNENAIKDAVMSAYKELFLHSDKEENYAQAADIIDNLSLIIENNSLGDLACIGVLLGNWLKSGHLVKEIIDILWDRCFVRSDNLKKSQQALIILTKAAAFDIEIIRKRIDQLVNDGLGQRAIDSFEWAKTVFDALLLLENYTKHSTESLDKPYRLSKDHLVFIQIFTLLCNGINNSADTYFSCMADRAIKCVYKLHPTPDRYTLQLLNGIAAEINLFGAINPDCFALERFISIVGQVALMQTIYLETTVYIEIKRRQLIKGNAKGKKSLLPVSGLNRSRRQSVRALVEPESNEEMECLEGATAEDPEADQIKDACDNLLVSDRCLIGSLIPYIVDILRDQEGIPTNVLIASHLALGKIMMVSEKLCQENISFLVTLLDGSPEAIIRSNSVIILADLSLRFPNIIEPFSGHLYQHIKDESYQVQRNTLTILSFLILHDRVKVKGQISEVALCIVNPNSDLSAMAKFLFVELGKKDNIMYNILPDIISHLSHPEKGTTSENFKVILKFLMPLVTKCQHIEKLIEKLCQKLGSAELGSQWEDFSYCLTFFSYSEKCLNILYQNRTFYINKLSNEATLKNFQTVLSDAKKPSNLKQEAKDILQHLEAILTKASSAGLNDNPNSDDKENEGAEIQAPKKKVPSRPGRSKRTRRNSSSDDDEEFTAKTPLRPKTPRLKAAKAKKALEVFSSDGED